MCFTAPTAIAIRIYVADVMKIAQIVPFGMEYDGFYGKNTNRIDKKETY